MKQYFENSNNLEVIETSEEFVSEKEKALYHEFMKGLQILDILHAAWLKLDDIIVVNIRRLRVLVKCSNFTSKIFFRLKIFLNAAMLISLKFLDHAIPQLRCVLINL